MNIEHLGGDNRNGYHTEFWGTKNEMTELELSETMDELCSQKPDVMFFVKEEAEVYYLDKETRQFKVLGQ